MKSVFCISSLFFYQWSSTASLHSFLRSSMLHYRQPSVNFDSELTTLEPILSRRWPLLSSSERKKRWTMEDDNDEIIIPIDDTFIQQSISATRTDNNLTVTKNDSNELFSFNSTMAKEQSNMSSSETDSDENSTVASTINEIKYPLLRQDFTGINETNELKSMSINDDISQNSQTSIEQFYEDNENLTTINNIFSSTASNEILDNNSKELEISSINASDINQIILSEKNETINDTIGNLTISEIISKFYYIKFKYYLSFLVLLKVVKVTHHLLQYYLIKL